jgi:hypothetical protein
MKILIRANDEGQNVIDFEPVFKMFNAELSNMGISLKLVCAGGYVMQLHGYRGTADVDAFYKSNAEIDGIIRKVGDQFGINRADEMWLNNSISNMNTDPPDSYCEPVYHFSNLTVKAVDIIYLIGMKLHSGREQDLKDVADIVKAENNKQPLELLSTLTEIGFNPDISDLLDSFGTAHGVDWLEAFYETHQAELRKYF